VGSTYLGGLMNENHERRMADVVPRKAILALLRNYYSQGCPKPDPRKNSNPRLRRKTDASTGHAYFLGDDGSIKAKYRSFDPDISTTKAVYNRMIWLGVYETDETFEVFHKRMEDLKNGKQVEEATG